MKKNELGAINLCSPTLNTEVSMNTLKACDSCKGTKRILGMGAMYQDCKPCNGIGFIEVKVTETLQDIIREETAKTIETIKPHDNNINYQADTEKQDVAIPRKKRGRRRKPIIQLVS